MEFLLTPQFQHFIFAGILVGILVVGVFIFRDLRIQREINLQVYKRIRKLEGGEEGEESK